MNRRGFFRGVLACAMTAAARVYTPSALSTSKVMHVPVLSDFVWLTVCGTDVSPSRGMQVGYKTYTAPVSHPFPPLRGHAVMLPGQIHAPHNPFEVGP